MHLPIVIKIFQMFDVYFVIYWIMFEFLENKQIMLDNDLPR